MNKTKSLKNKKKSSQRFSKAKPSASAAQENFTYSLNQLYFYLTEGCNLCCRHCWIDPPHQAKGRSYPVLDFKLFKSAVEQGKQLGLSGVKLTGGEPIMHPQISDILEYLRSADIQLTIETNGILCTAELAQKIASCKNPFVSVSIDGSDAATYEWVRGVAGSFDAALQGIRHLAAAGLKPQIIMSIMRRNIHQVEAVVRLAESLGASSVKFNLIQPTARGEKMHDSGESLTIQELVELGRWVENDLASRTHLQLFFDQPMAFRSLGRMFSANSNGCGRCGILGILGVLASGSYALCGIGETVPELIFGHISTNFLREVWNTNQMLSDIRKGLPGRLEGICGCCIMKNLCLGSCIAQNYYRNRDIWAPYWYCQEAEKAGLFPKSRKIL